MTSESKEELGAPRLFDGRQGLSEARQGHMQEQDTDVRPHSYHGGKYTFLRWLGLNTGAYGAEFLTNANAINAYKVSLRLHETSLATF